MSREEALPAGKGFFSFWERLTAQLPHDTARQSDSATKEGAARRNQSRVRSGVGDGADEFRRAHSVRWMDKSMSQKAFMLMLRCMPGIRSMRQSVRTCL